MKKPELIFNLISIPVDAATLFLAGIGSFFLRQHTTTIVGPVIYQMELQSFVLLAAKIVPFLLLIFAFLGLYNLRGTRKFSFELGKVIEGVSFGLLLVILLFFFRQNLFPSRFIVLAAWGLGIAFVIFGRLVLKQIQKLFFYQNIGLHKLAVIEPKSLAGSASYDFFKKKSYGYQIICEVGYTLEIFQTLERLYNRGEIDEILQADTTLNEQENFQLVQFARSRGISFSFVPNLFNVQRNTVETYDLRGLPVISLKNTPLDGWGRVAKRIMDVVFSAICLILTSPLFLIVALAIKLDSKGRVIYSAPRCGKGKNFMFYKFRSMYSHLSVGDNYGGKQAETVRKQLWEKNDRGGVDGPFLKIKHDPRVTRVGRFLRKTKLDEIPQFWNIFKGDMSMVGPRAHVLDEVEKYQSRYQRMFSIKPGSFGLSQLEQMSVPDLPFEEEIRLNTYYIENWSLWLDLKILTESFYRLFFGKKSNEDY